MDALTLPDYVPATGLIHDHYQYATWSTNAPPIFHVGSMLTTLAGAVADSAMIISDGVPHPLHVWVMLVGQSTRDRKTTSARLAADRLASVIPERIQRIYGSPEGLIQALVQQPCSLIFIPEGGALFAQREAGYWKHAKEMLMDIYDFQTEFTRKLAKEVITIKHPRASLLAAIAKGLLERYTTDVDWMGGFMARFLTLSGTPIDRITPHRRDPQREAAIERQLHQLAHHPWGNLPIGSAARRVLLDFDREIEVRIDDFHEGLQPSMARLPATAVRLAGLYEIASRAGTVLQGTPLVRVGAAQAAVALCRASVNIALQETVRDLAVPANSFHKHLIKVEAEIRQQGPEGAVRSTLLRKFGYSARQMDEIITSLDQQGVIEQRLARTRGRPATIYVHTDPMQTIDMTQVPTPQAWVDLSGKTPPRLDGLKEWDPMNYLYYDGRIGDTEAEETGQIVWPAEVDEVARILAEGAQVEPFPADWDPDEGIWTDASATGSVRVESGTDNSDQDGSES
jgi:hypothetical protein